MSKTELLATAGSLEELKRLFEAGADAISIGNEEFGLRLPGSFSLTEMNEAVKYAHSKNRKIYIAVNALMHNDVLPKLPNFLTGIAEIGADAIEFADPAVLMTAREQVPELALHWNAEIIATSINTVNYWASKGIKRAVLSRELNMDEIAEIKDRAEIEIGMQVHGMSCIFYSKRPLVSSYFQHQGRKIEEESTDQGRRLYLREEKRDDISYPIYEDRCGTHIMSSEDICALEHMDELLDLDIDSLRVEGLLKQTEYNEIAVKAYRMAIDLYKEDPDSYFESLDSLLETIKKIQDPKRPLSTGFFFKELVF